MTPIPRSISLRFPQAYFHAAHALVSWHPSGVLDDKLLDEIAVFVQIQEREQSELPFNRFTDLSGLTEVRLQIGHVFRIAEMRIAANRDRAPVKSAIFCDKTVGYGIARMYETLMEGSTIDVRAFRERVLAEEWLGVPLQILSEPS